MKKVIQAVWPFSFWGKVVHFHFEWSEKSGFISYCNFQSEQGGNFSLDVLYTIYIVLNQSFLRIEKGNNLSSKAIILQRLVI